jgi:hypothetical protein
MPHDAQSYIRLWIHVVITTCAGVFAGIVCFIITREIKVHHGMTATHDGNCESMSASISTYSFESVHTALNQYIEL